MQTKVLVIGIVQQNGAVLMRKKPDGSPPYSQTWYLFGGEVTDGIDAAAALQRIVSKQAGIEISLKEKFSWDTEIKKDIDGIEKQFIYLDVLCEYIRGDLTAANGIEKLEWVPTDKLADYDIVPPSVAVFKKLGWLSQ